MSKDKNNNIINFPQKKSKLEREVEAIIFAAEEPKNKTGNSNILIRIGCLKYSLICFL